MGQMLAHQPRVYDNAIQRAAVELRSDLSELRGSMELRRQRLEHMQSCSVNMTSMADAITAEVRTARQTMRHDRQHTPHTPHTPRTPWRPSSPPLPSRSLGSTDRSSSSEAERESLLRAARERMRRRGVLPDGAASGVANAPSARAQTMFDRLSALRAAAAVLGPELRPGPTDPLDDSTLAALRAHEVRSSVNLPDDCPICIEPRRRGQQLLHLGCGHCFHAVCAQRWLAQSACCPLCRTVVPRKAAGS